jgi:hypothetical protein
VKKIFLIVAVLGLGYSTALSEAIDQSKPTGRACLGIVNTKNGDEEMLRAASTAGPNQKVVLHLDATAACEVFVGPFVKSGELVPGWQCQYVSLSPGKESVLPMAPGSWSWEKEIGPLEIFVLFFAPGSKEGTEIRDLARSMRMARSATLIKMQTTRLRELVGNANYEKEAARHAPKASSEVAGVMRTVVGFEWRDSARAVNFAAGKPGALIFPFADAR